MLKFRKTTEYSFRIFAHMAYNHKRLYRADELYEDLQIPHRYMKRLLTELTKTGLLESIQGNKGGYRLKRDPFEITLFDIIRATEMPKDKNLCFFGFQECHFSKKKCYMHDNWVSLISGIEQKLKTTTLSDLRNAET